MSTLFHMMLSLSLHKYLLKNASTNIIRGWLEKDEDLKNLQLMKFIFTTTYFTFCGTIYKQKFGGAIGSPVSPLTINIFMEWLE